MIYQNAARAGYALVQDLDAWPPYKFFELRGPGQAGRRLRIAVNAIVLSVPVSVGVAKHDESHYND